jgi:peptidoglycan-associated lipoprotein
MKELGSMVWTTLQITLLVVAALAACGTKKKDEATTPDRVVGREVPAGGAAAADASGGGDGSGGAKVAPGAFGPIYFSYDGAELTEAGRAELQRAGEYLGLHPESTMVIAGHADERGTPEYNLALGQERARVVSDYLRRLGIDATRLRAVSYGEERPAVEGSDESSWAKNRRAELEVAR